MLELGAWSATNRSRAAWIAVELAGSASAHHDHGHRSKGHGRHTTRRGHRRDVHRHHRPGGGHRQGHHREGLQPQDRPGRRADRGGRARARARRRRPRTSLAARARLDPGHQRGAGEQAAEERAGDYRGVPRRAGDRASLPPRHVRPHAGQAAAGGAARAPLRHRRTHLGDRGDPRGARPIRRRRADRSHPGRRGRGGGGVPAQLVPEPRQRGTCPRLAATGPARGEHLGIARRLSRDPRVRAHEHRGAERGRHAAGPALPRRRDAAGARPAPQRARAADAVERGAR